MALHRLVAASSPLDPNSVYCNLLQVSHFGATSLGAFAAERLVGSITAYCPPGRPDTLFVWQVAIDASMRGQGLAQRLLQALVERCASNGVRYVEASITPDNEASMRLFARFAENNGLPSERSVMFDKQLHFDGEHETEYLFRFGPLQPHDSHDPHDTIDSPPTSTTQNLCVPHQQEETP